MKIENIRSSSFENVAEIYNEIRPGYPIELYEKILQYKNIDNNSHILEIGSGHGIATREILDAYRCNVTAVEPGKQLCNFIIERTKKHNNIDVCNLIYEDFTSSIKFDAIFSATAFHWISKEVKYIKSYNELKNDGILVLYWNNYSIHDRVFNEKVQNIYNNHSIGELGIKSIYDVQEEKINNRRSELVDSGLFILVDSGTLLKTYNFTSEKYIKLLKSFSDHSTKEECKMGIFYNDINNLIMKNNDTIKIDILVNYLIARKNLTTAST